MRRPRFAIAFFAGCSVVLAADISKDSTLLACIKSLEGFTRVTNQRVTIPTPVDEGCAEFEHPKINHAYLTKGSDPAIHVYVTKEAHAMFQQRNTVFPEGTIVLKQKFANRTTEVAELYTGMIKREKGYSPKAGDWEFFTANGDATAIISRGRIDSCMDCHQQYASSDFVTRQYVDGKFPKRTYRLLDAEPPPTFKFK